MVEAGSDGLNHESRVNEKSWSVMGQLGGHQETPPLFSEGAA